MTRQEIEVFERALGPWEATDADDEDMLDDLLLDISALDPDAAISRDQLCEYLHSKK